mmetsp:Transcript_120037/g.224407  ORF Transcript_120037/g.224407 Transcript_120037/m.224407 type:complete len:488 (-) Transcript_120037:54-1517(-)
MSVSDVVPEYRTRWLWFVKFMWGACMGRFMSLYYLAEGLDEAEIGAVFAAGSVSGPLLSTAIGIMADRLAVRVVYGRQLCVAGCIVLGSLAFLLQAVHLPGVSRFTVMIVCRVFFTGFNTSADILIQAITVNCLRDRKRFGNERLYGAISWAIMHLLLGMLTDRYGPIVQHVCLVPSALAMLFVICALGTPPPPDSSTGPTKRSAGLSALADNKALLALLKSYGTSLPILAFFFYAITLGIGMSIVENLIFLLFRELKASNFLCGVSVVVTVVFEIPLFSVAPRLLERIGVPGLLAAAGLCYSFRVVGYTLCPGGWYVLLFEPMHGVTIATFNTATTEFVAKITPPALSATGIALFQLLRGGLGSSTGTFGGGAIIRRFGESACYRTSAVVVLVGLIVYIATRLLSGDAMGYESVKEPQQDLETKALAEPVPAGFRIGVAQCEVEEPQQDLETKALAEPVPAGFGIGAGQCESDVQGAADLTETVDD